ncbi:MAG: hypothetical protein Q8J74_06595 [Candidatus Didemnitutus sp.]|nr:hypothetical protein [Candidatus Didemnitutus sp.]
MKTNLIRFFVTYVLYKAAGNIPVIETFVEDLRDWKLRYYLADFLLWVVAYVSAGLFSSMATRHWRQLATVENKDED